MKKVIMAETMRPKQGMGCFGACRATGHYKAWFCTLWMIFFILSYILCAVDIDRICQCDCYYFGDECIEDDYTTCKRVWAECGFPCSMTYKLGAWFFVIAAIAYMLYAWEIFCCSSTYQYLKNSHESQTATKYIEGIKANPPKIVLKMVCYHYESDSDGNRSKKVTHVGRKTYKYRTWKDVSAEVTGFNEWSLTKLKNYKTFSFANGATENDYKRTVREFKAANRRDQYQDFSFDVQIAGFKKFILIESEPGAKPGLVSLRWYLASSFLLCTTCYRMYFSSVCGRKKYVFNKQISI